MRRKRLIGEKIKSRRLELGMGISYLEKQGVTPSTLYRAENDEGTYTSGKTIEQLCSILQLEPDDVTIDVEYHNRPGRPFKHDKFVPTTNTKVKDYCYEREMVEYY